MVVNIEYRGVQLITASDVEDFIDRCLDADPSLSPHPPLQHKALIEDDRWFGTHLREAAAIIREIWRDWRKKEGERAS